MEIIKWDKKSSFLKYKNQVAIIKEESYIKVYKEYYTIIDYIIKNKLDISNLKQYFEDLQDCNKVLEIIVKLKAIKAISVRGYDEADRIGCITLNSISLIITNKCNLSCVHCSQNAGNENSNKSELTFKEVCKVIDIITKNNLDSITITGGEPLVRKDFLDIVKYLRSKYKGEMVLLTNGLLISKENVKNLINSFNYISISMDGIDEELTSKIRGEGVYNQVIKAIEMLHSYGFFNIELSAILPCSLQVEKKFNALCKTLSVKPVGRSLIYSGRAFQNASYINDIYQSYIKNHGYSVYDNIKNLDIGSLEVCEACSKTLSIDPAGEVYPCNLLQSPSFKIGNILLDNDIIDKYQNSDITKNINKMKKMDVEPCVNCDIKHLCWFCLADFEEFKQHKSLHKDYCEKRKQSIYKYYFGD